MRARRSALLRQPAYSSLAAAAAEDVGFLDVGLLSTWAISTSLVTATISRPLPYDDGAGGLRGTVRHRCKSPLSGDQRFGRGFADGGLFAAGRVALAESSA